MPKPNQIIAFDIDGTLLNDERKVGARDYETLIGLGRCNILRIAATGRNYYSVQRVLPPNFPIDYLVFSSGAGVMDWASKQILKTAHLGKSDIEKTVEVVRPYKLNFTIHLPIPNNHHILLNSSFANSGDLVEYTSFYKKYVEPLNPGRLPDRAAQIIVLLNSHVNLFYDMQNMLKPLKTILTTSPINHKSMWMEVFNNSVSKANGVQWVKEYLNITGAPVLAIGNDYNDLDLLDYAQVSFVVANAPAELHKKYMVTLSNNENGITGAVKSQNIY